MPGTGAMRLGIVAADREPGNGRRLKKEIKPESENWRNSLGKKSESDLALADKIDAARTLFKLRQRSEYRRSMSEIEQAIADRHQDEIQDGRITTINYGNPLDLLGPGDSPSEGS